MFGRDYYAFTARTLYGIALNSSLIHSPGKAPALADAQERWLESDLARAYKSQVDPRLNYEQAMEIAMLIGGRLRTHD